MKNRHKMIICLFLVFVIFVYVNGSYAKTDPTLVNKLNTALKNIQSYLVKLATPAAGVSIAAGVMIRKFSFVKKKK